MKRTGAFVILAILLLTFFVAQQITDKNIVNISGNVIKAVEQEGSVRVYIKFKDSAVKGKGIASDVKKEITDLVNIKHEFKDKVSAVISEAELEELQSNPNIESIEVVGTRNIVLQDSVPLINATTIHNSQFDGINLTGLHETVCVIDTGVDYNHTDLGGCFGEGCKVIGGYDYCADDINCTTSDSDPMDAHYHGTHVSGTIIADGSITGVAPGAKLVVIKAANSTGTFWDDDLEKAIDWCVNNASTFNISVISMSLGGGTYSSYCNDDPLNDSINNAIANDISVVVATGNIPESTTQISAPACHQNVTPVGCISKDDSTFRYNRNSLVQLIAPGRDINSTDSGGGYRTLHGTSMSTPHVAGAIAILNQFRRLEGSAVFTPAEVEDALNDSGFRINDSEAGGSNIEYSRIDIYSTILDIDSSGPEITINGPSDNTLSANGNQTFNCSATDALQLANLTFQIWNASDILINETSQSASENTLEVTKNLTLDNGTYTWRCVGYDNNSNLGNSSNYTIKIGAMSLSLSPSDETYTDDTQTNFTCDVEDSVANLTNTTFMIFNLSGNLAYNKTENISGSSNSSVFNYTFTYERDYEWNCYVYDEQDNSISANSNYTLTYDNTNPVVTLISPEHNADASAGTINFKFNVTDTNEIDNCSLIVDNEMLDDDNSIDRNETETISESMSSSGSYDWKISCRDITGNVGTSSEWEIDITSDDDDDDDDDGGGSTSGGTGSVIPITFIISDEDFKNGTSKYMKDSDIMKFNSNSENHSLKLDDVKEIKIIVIISSDPVTLTVNVGESEKADLDADNRYDIGVTYIEYKNTLAKVMIKEIDEAIPTREIQPINVSTEENSNETIVGVVGENISKITGKVTDFFENNKWATYVLIGVIALGITTFLVYNNRKDVKKYLQKRKMFKKGEKQSL